MNDPQVRILPFHQITLQESAQIFVLKWLQQQHVLNAFSRVRVW